MEFPRLVLARKSRDSVVIVAIDASQELVRVTVIDVCGGRVILGFQADNDVAIHREEVWERVRAEKQAIKPKEPVEKPKYRVPYID
jgi:carbon storage regulator